jgi:hypothetical protein
MWFLDISSEFGWDVFVFSLAWRANMKFAPTVNAFDAVQFSRKSKTIGFQATQTDA